MKTLDIINTLLSLHRPMNSVTVYCEIINDKYNFPIGNKRFMQVSKQDLRFVVGHVYRVEYRGDSKTYETYLANTEVVICLGRYNRSTSDIKTGDNLAIRGTIYNYDMIPVLGWETSNKELKPVDKTVGRSRVLSGHKPTNIPIPRYRIIEEIDKEAIEAFKSEHNLKNKVRKDIDKILKIRDFCRENNIYYQEEFREIADLLNEPYIQLVVGRLNTEAVEKVLTYLTDDDWVKVGNVKEKKDSTKLKVQYCRDGYEVIDLLPVVDLMTME